MYARFEQSSARALQVVLLVLQLHACVMTRLFGDQCYSMSNTYSFQAPGKAISCITFCLSLPYSKCLPWVWKSLKLLFRA